MQVSGAGLFLGNTVHVEITACTGPVRLRAGGTDAPLSAWRVVGTSQTTTIGHRDARVGLVEHVCAALGGLGIREGVSIAVDGEEFPLLDGGAATWCEHFASFAPTGASSLRVAKAATLHHGASRYAFEPGHLEMSVQLEWQDASLQERAAWGGDAADFVARLAPARTFAFRTDLDAWARADRRMFASPEAVVVLSPDGALCSGRPFANDEPARHKLTDLIGDSYLYGGPPLGRLHAFRPGHTATHAIFQEALETGVLVNAPFS